MLLFHSITVESEENSSLFQPGIFCINVALVVLWVVLTLQSPRPHPCSEGNEDSCKERRTSVAIAAVIADCMEIYIRETFIAVLTVFSWNSNVIGQMVMSHFTLRADFIWTRWGAKSNERGDRKATGMFLKDDVPQETGEENICCRVGAVDARLGKFDVSTDDSNSQPCNYKLICRGGCRLQTSFHLPQNPLKEKAGCSVSSSFSQTKQVGHSLRDYNIFWPTIN